MTRRTRPAGYLVSVIVTLGIALICTFVLGRTYNELPLTTYEGAFQPPFIHAII